MLAAIEEDHAVIVDLTGVSYVSPGGLLLLLRMSRTSIRRGGTALVCVATGPNKEILEFGGLDKIMPVCETLEDALDATGV